jgi:NAD(P)-dependent dehydrogenase (short-subunit alcohol dehydrogenase family)
MASRLRGNDGWFFSGPLGRGGRDFSKERAKMEFKDRIVVVTGASAGLGRAQAEAFATEGATIAVLGTNAERTEEVAAGIRARGGRAGAYLADVSSRDAVEQIFGRIIAELGGIDVLINNAGFAYGNIYSLMAIDDETLRKVFEVNVFGIVHCARGRRAAAARSSTSPPCPPIFPVVPMRRPRRRLTA